MKQNNIKSQIITIPNVLSFFRICLIPVMVWLYCVEQKYQLTGYILILSGATDVVDGFIARKFHMISDFGKVLDPIADKLTQAAMLLCLVFRFPLMIIPFILMVVKELYMAITGLIIIHRSGEVMGANWHGKVATCLLYAMMILHVFWYDITFLISTISIVVCTLMIGLSFILYGTHNMRKLKKA